jgi:hypothetical protein
MGKETNHHLLLQRSYSLSLDASVLRLPSSSLNTWSVQTLTPYSSASAAANPHMACDSPAHIFTLT